RYPAARFPRHAFPVELARIIHERTEGHPLFMVSLVDELLSAGAIRIGDGTWTFPTAVAEIARQGPDSVKRAIECRLERLSPDEQRVLEAASVAGDEFVVPVVAAAIESDPICVEG